MTTGTGQQGIGTEPPAAGGCAGMTLVEVAVAMGLSALMCAGLFKLGIAIQRQAEQSRIATEARSLAKERMEDIYAVGLAKLITPTCASFNGATNASTILPEYDIVRQPRVTWHTASGAVTNATAAAYAEVHVDVSYWSPLSRRQRTDSYSMIVAE